MLETRLVKSDDETPFVKDPSIIKGLKNYKTEVKERFPIEKSSIARLSSASNSQKTIIEFSDLRPGSAIAFMFNLHPDQVLVHIIDYFCCIKKSPNKFFLCWKISKVHKSTFTIICNSTILKMVYNWSCFMSLEREKDLLFFL